MIYGGIENAFIWALFSGILFVLFFGCILDKILDKIKSLEKRIKELEK